MNIKVEIKGRDVICSEVLTGDESELQAFKDSLEKNGVKFMPRPKIDVKNKRAVIGHILNNPFKLEEIKRIIEKVARESKRFIVLDGNVSNKSGIRKVRKVRKAKEIVEGGFFINREDYPAVEIEFLD